MLKLGLFLVTVGLALGPLLTARSMRRAMLSTEIGHDTRGATSVATNEALAATAAGATVALSGAVLVMISRYRRHDGFAPFDGE